MYKNILLCGVSAFAVAIAIAMAGPASAQEQPEFGATAEVGVDDQSVIGNSASDFQSLRENTIGADDEDSPGSFNDGAGVLHVQQNNGSNNSIGAASAVTGGLVGDVPVIVGSGAISTTNTNFTVHQGSGDLEVVDRENAVTDSFGDADGNGAGFAGVATVQQNNGDHNEMGAATAVYGSTADLGTVSMQAFATGSTSLQSGTGEGGELTDDLSNRRNGVTSSYGGASGIATLQQNNGNGNAVSAATAVASASTTGAVFMGAAANGTVRDQGVVDNGLDRSNFLSNSYNNYGGIATVQQNNGDANVLSAATSAAMVTGAATGVSQSASAGGAVLDVGVTDNGNSRSNSVFGFNGASGIVTVQQNNGSANVMSSATSVATTGGDGNIVQNAFKGGSVSGAIVSDTGVVARNDVSSSFVGASGVATVQQNNGSANVMSSATAVAVSKGTVSQFVSGSDTVTGNTVSDATLSNGNSVVTSFNSYDGVATVQQNNGNANVISAATAVAANSGPVSQFAQKFQNVTGNNVKDLSGSKANSIFFSGSGASGVLTVQQNNGHGNAIDAATAVAVNDSSQSVFDSGTVAGNIVSTPNQQGSGRGNSISIGFGQAAGVIIVQQNNGHANALSAATAVVDAGSETTVGQTVSAGGTSLDNTVSENFGMSLGNTMSSSFNGASGTMAVQQNNGHANDISAATAVATAASQPPASGVVSQSVGASGRVSGNAVTDNFVQNKSNSTIASFIGASGVATVQQNNGSGNVMTASSAVQAIEGLNFGTGSRSQAVSATGVVSGSSVVDLEFPPTLGDRRNLAASSFGGADGVATVQQNNGSNNVMASATAVSVEPLDDASVGADQPQLEVVESQTVSAGGVVSTVSSRETGLDAVPPPFDRDNQIGGSFNDFSGIASVQQNNGDHNVVSAATGVAANINAGDDIDIVGNSVASTNGSVNLSRSVDLAANRNNGIGASFVGAGGVLTVQQNNGNANVVAAATAVAVNENIFFNDFDGVGGTASNSSAGTALVEANSATASESDRANAIGGGSFNGASGVSTVQQNNGDNNVVGASTAVISDNPLPGFGPAASSAVLGASVTGNTSIVTLSADGTPVAYANTITSSYNGASGVMTVQQNNGANNAIQSAVTVNANF